MSYFLGECNIFAVREALLKEIENLMHKINNEKQPKNTSTAY